MTKAKRNTSSANAEVQLYDLDIEKAALYCMMLDNKLIKASSLNEDDFYKSSHQKIYQTMYHMADDGLGVDFLTLPGKLKELGWFEEIGGLLYLKTLMDSEPSLVMFSDYERLLKLFWVKRKLFDLGTTLTKGVDNNGNLFELIQSSRNSLRDLSDALAGKNKTIASQVEDWVQVTDGKFVVTDVYRDLAIVNPSNKKAVLMALHRMEKTGQITKCGEKRGCYKSVPIDMESVSLEMKESDEIEYPLQWPRAIPMNDWVKFFPKQLIVIAGEPQAGKTALMLNMAYLNLQRPEIPRIDYFNSEGGDQEFRLRLMDFCTAHGVDYQTWQSKKLHVWERSRDFAEVINPNGLNFVDYLEIEDEFYLIGKYLTHIWRRLDQGIAVVAIQKDPKKDLGKGGFAILEKPRLVINMMLGGKAQIVKGKSWRNKLINPDKKMFFYRIEGGCKFIPREVKNYNGGVSE